MDSEKLRNLTDAELVHQQREMNDQLFRLKFQLKMGQTESLNKIRGLRKDVARVKTIMREKELGLTNGAASTAKAATPKAEPAAPKAARAKKSSAKKKTTAAKKKTASAAAKARKK